MPLHRLVSASFVLVVGSADLLRPSETKAMSANDCPQVITVSYCPISSEGACEGYGCITDIANCSDFGGAYRLYCGTPSGD
jgi:hypothetical protein